MNTNLNTQVSVVLTDLGLEILRRHMSKMRVQIIPGFDGSTRQFKTMLWDLMAVFGPELYHGQHALFVSNEVTINQDDTIVDLDAVVNKEGSE